MDFPTLLLGDEDTAQQRIYWQQKNFPEQIYLVMVNTLSPKMDIAGFISPLVAVAKLHASS